MTTSMRGRSLISLADLSADDIQFLLDCAARLKMDRRAGHAHAVLAGRTLAMIFQKPSLRTRVAFEVGMCELGGHVVNLSPADIQLGQRETTEDIALVLSRYCDVLMARTFSHRVLDELARFATVPVINGLSDDEHPCQVLADLLTIRERLGRLAGVRVAYVGDANNVANSWMLAAAVMGMRLTVCCPPDYVPRESYLQRAIEVASSTGAAIEVTHEPRAGCRDAEVVYTDVWTSMGQEAERDARQAAFAGFQVNAALLDVAARDAIVMHCLPALYGEEIDYETSRRSSSAIFDQAENRLHAHKALLASLLGA